MKNNIAFALDLYKYLASQPGNLFFSPYSISTTLAMTYAGARGKTATEMAEVLHFPMEQEKLHSAFAELRKTLESDIAEKAYQLNIANRLWGQADYHFSDDFLQLIQKYYGAGFETVDFQNATEAARVTINQWVEEQTNGKIVDLLAPGILDELTRLVLTNAIYFKGSWLEAFSVKSTRNAPFTTASGEKINVPMMFGKKYRYGLFKLDIARIIELPYQTYDKSVNLKKSPDEGTDKSMVIIVPWKVDGLAEIERQLTPTLLEEWLSVIICKSRSVKLELGLPKFKLDAEFKLKDALSSLGMPTAFCDGQANFSGMYEDNLDLHKLHIKNVIHKAFMEVNELGTEAAAATAIVVRARSLPPRLIVDRPFLFLIRDRISGSILFMGRVVNPLNEN